MCEGIETQLILHMHTEAYNFTDNNLFSASCITFSDLTHLILPSLLALPVSPVDCPIENVVCSINSYFSFSFPAIASCLSLSPCCLCPLLLRQPCCSPKKSSSASDDSDCDTSPRLTSAPSPCGPSPSHSHAHRATAHTALVVGKRSIQLHDCDNEGMF